MKQTAKALKQFFGGFGIPAYISDNLPDNVKMPYITYDLVEPEPLAYGYMNASVWYKSESALELIEKVDEIKANDGDNNTEQVAGALCKLPGLFLKFALWLINLLDYFDLLIYYYGIYMQLNRFRYALEIFRLVQPNFSRHRTLARGGISAPTRQ